MLSSQFALSRKNAGINGNSVNADPANLQLTVSKAGSGDMPLEAGNMTSNAAPDSIDAENSKVIESMGAAQVNTKTNMQQDGT
jgi:hypothetical protein